MKTAVSTLLLFLLISLSGISAFAGAPFKKVLTVILENESNESAYEQNYLRKLATEGALLTNMQGVAHPSYPNYIALTSGSTWHIRSDHQQNLDVAHIGDLLEAKGKTWKVYAEGYPGNCFLDSKLKKYARRHVPFLSYVNVQSNPERCAHIVPADQLVHDIAAGTLPDYMLYIPDNNNNGHDKPISYADQFLERTFGPLLQDSQFTKDLLFIVTFDEDDYLHDNHIYTVLWGESVIKGARPSEHYNHYSLLRTIEDAFELGTLGKNDSKAGRITGIWR